MFEPGEIVRGHRDWSLYQWDPRWCKDPEVLQTPCRKGHVNRGVTQDAKLYCRTCEPHRGRNG